MTDKQNFEIKALVNWLNEDTAMTIMWHKLENLNPSKKTFKTYATENIKNLWETGEIYLDKRYYDVPFIEVDGKILNYDKAWNQLRVKMTDELEGENFQVYFLTRI